MTEECAHCGTPDGLKFVKGKNAVLCWDCRKENIPVACIRCLEFNSSCPEEQPCAWCTRNKEIVMKDNYKKDVGYPNNPWN